MTSKFITERIMALLAKRNLKRLHLAHKAGIANETIYRCLNGVRNWNLGHLELIAPVLGVALVDLFQKPIVVPRVGGIRDGQGPPQAHILRPAPDQESTGTLAKMYCLEVEDRSMMPSFPPGTHLIAQWETSDTIKNEDHVVFWSEDGKTYIRQIFLNSDRITLRSLARGDPDKIIPLKLLNCCDKIIRVDFK